MAAPRSFRLGPRARRLSTPPTVAWRPPRAPPDPLVPLALRAAQPERVETQETRGRREPLGLPGRLDLTAPPAPPAPHRRSSDPRDPAAGIPALRALAGRPVDQPVPPDPRATSGHRDRRGRRVRPEPASRARPARRRVVRSPGPRAARPPP